MLSDGSGFTAPGEPLEFPDVVHKSWGAKAPYKADEKEIVLKWKKWNTTLLIIFYKSHKKYRMSLIFQRRFKLPKCLGRATD